MKSKLFTIDDLLLGETRKVRICVNELVLTPDYIKGFKEYPINTALLGVVNGFGEVEEKPFVKLEPFYRITMPVEGDLSSAIIKRWEGANSLYTNFFKTIFTGPAEAISQALIDGPFANIAQLAYAIKGLQLPYNEALERLLEGKTIKLAKTGSFD